MPSGSPRLRSGVRWPHGTYCGCLQRSPHPGPGGRRRGDLTSPESRNHPPEPQQCLLSEGRYFHHNTENEVLTNNNEQMPPFRGILVATLKHACVATRTADLLVSQPSDSYDIEKKFMPSKSLCCPLWLYHFLLYP